MRFHLVSNILLQKKERVCCQSAMKLLNGERKTVWKINNRHFVVTNFPFRHLCNLEWMVWNLCLIQVYLYKLGYRYSKSSRPSSCNFSTAYHSHSSGVGILPLHGIFLHYSLFSGSESFHSFSIRVDIIVLISSTAIFRSRANCSKICSLIIMPPAE